MVRHESEVEETVDQTEGLNHVSCADASRAVNEISGDDFARRFSLRPGQLMWLLGAGASVSAGIPSAWEMIWQFKQTLFITQRKTPAESVADLSDPNVRALLDSHVAGSEHLPPVGSPDEYAALFEATYPAERDRATFIQGMISGGKLAYGHLALAALLKSEHAKLVWTTNFDHLVEDACARAFGTTGALSVVALDAPDLAGQLIATRKWPILFKLHGDFRSRRLKNTADELRQQDAALRRHLVEACQRNGLVVAGYSGRDASIMDALEDALEHPDAFTGGLFWLHRGLGEPLDRVTRLLQRASRQGIECGLVRIESFDETLRDLVRLLPDLDTSPLKTLASGRSRVSGAPTPSGRRGWPLIRLNALEVTAMPTNCRKVVCQIAGVAAVRAAISEAGAQLIATRTRAGVLGFGSDPEFRRTFSPFCISQFDLATFETKRLRYDSGERGLLRDALVSALCTTRGLRALRRRSADLLVPTNPTASEWNGLRAVAGEISGTLHNRPEVPWSEGVSVRLDWAKNRLWLLLDPRIVFDVMPPDMKAAAADFARERTVKRYNRDLNNLIQFWSRRLAGESLRALGIGDGIDAVFSIGSRTGFSRLAQP